MSVIVKGRESVIKGGLLGTGENRRDLHGEDPLPWDNHRFLKKSRY